MKPIHVVQLGPVPPPYGGITSNILAIRKLLIERGHRCSLVATSRSSDPTTSDDIHHPRSPIELISTLRTLDPDVVHLHVGGDIPLRVLAMARYVTRWPRTVFTLHSGGYPTSPEGVGAKARSMRGSTFRRFSRIIAINDELNSVFLRYGVDEGQIVSISPFAPAEPDASVALPAHLADFAAKHSPFLIAVGGLETDYDPLFQVAAMNEIVASHPDAGLMIVGNGTLRPEVEKAVEASVERDRICLAGSLEHAVTLHLMERSDALLRTTLFDGDAISVREALYLGTPVIATDNGMRPDGVHLICHGDVAALCDRIGEIIAVGAPRARQSPDRSNIEAIVELYRELVEAGT